MNIIDIEKSDYDVNLMSPLVWAYVGDSVYEMYIRTYLINKSNLSPNDLHVEAIKYVSAKSQAKILEVIEDRLTDDEKDIVRRTRNSESYHKPKNTTLAEYTYATAFEGLIGFLYLNKKNDRLKELLNYIVENYNTEEV